MVLVAYPILLSSYWELSCGYRPHPRFFQAHCRLPWMFPYAGLSPSQASYRPAVNHTPPFSWFDRSLTMHLLHFQQFPIAPITHRTYSAALSHFHIFCSSKYHLTTFPASPIVLRYFCVDLVATIKHTTFTLYITALRFFYIELGYPHPTQDALLKCTIKGYYALGTRG